jgi:hypothetical protein
VATRSDDSRGSRDSRAASDAPSSPSRTSGQGSSSGFSRRLATLRAGAGRLGGARAIEILTIVLLAAGVLLIAVEFLDLFRVKIGAVVIDEQTGAERHSYALLLIGIAVCAAAMLARSLEAWPPAAGAAVLGGIVLAIALFGDLPDATRTDLVAGARLATAHPAAGFWVELTGAILAIVTGAVLAYLLRGRTSGDEPDRLPREAGPRRPSEAARSRG